MENEYANKKRIKLKILFYTYKQKYSREINLEYSSVMLYIANGKNHWEGIVVIYYQL